MKRLTLILLVAVLLPAFAFADPIFSFMGWGGTASWAGGTAPMLGTKIGVGLVHGIDTPEHSGLYAVTDGKLDFATGAFAGIIRGPNDKDILQFSPGGSFSIFGGISEFGLGKTLLSSTLLFSGRFTGITTYDPQAGVFRATTGSGVFDPPPAAVGQFFGFEGQVPFEFTTQVLSVASLRTDPAGGFSDQVTNVQLNTAPVPEPASIVLVSLVLLGCTTVMRRRKGHA